MNWMLRIRVSNDYAHGTTGATGVIREAEMVWSAVSVF